MRKEKGGERRGGEGRGGLKREISPWGGNPKVVNVLRAATTSPETGTRRERAKNKLATAVTLAEENPNGRMHGLGAQWLYLRRYTSLAEELQRLRAVTIDDLSNLIADTEFHRRTIVRLGPK